MKANCRDVLSAVKEGGWRQVASCAVCGQPASAFHGASGMAAQKERKQMVRAWVAEVKLAPDEQVVEATCQLPEPVMVDVVAGARYAAEKKTSLGRLLLLAAEPPPQRGCHVVP